MSRCYDCADIDEMCTCQTQSQFNKLQDALENAIGDVLSDFRDEFVPDSLQQIRQDHAKECKGIANVGGRLAFCGCFTSKAVESVIEMHRIWHQDLKLRINRIVDKEGWIEKQDVLFLIDENAKWG